MKTVGRIGLAVILAGAISFLFLSIFLGLIIVVVGILMFVFGRR